MFRRVIALCVALALVGGGASALPVAADAAPAKAKAAKKKAKAKKKKRKKKKPAPAAAQQGQPGPQGPAGPAGPPGTAVVARAKLAAPATYSGIANGKPALEGAKWTQQAGETDDFVGEVTMTLPKECTVSGPAPTDDPVWWLEGELGGWEYVGGAWVELMLGDQWVGYADFPVWEGEGGRTVTQSFQIERKLMEPETATDRELTARVDTYCENEDATFTLQALKVNVIGIR